MSRGRLCQCGVWNCPTHRERVRKGELKGLLWAIGVVMALGLLVVLNGCYSVGATLHEGPKLTAAEIEAFKGMDPKLAGKLIDKMGTDTAFASADFVEKVKRKIAASKDGKGAEAFGSETEHQGDSEFVTASGNALEKVNNSAAGLIASARGNGGGQTVPATSSPPPPAVTAAPAPTPAALPPGAPAGSTLNTGGPWLATDLLRDSAGRTSNHQRAALAIAINEGWPGMPKAPAEAMARFNGGLMTVGEFYGYVPRSSESDPRVTAGLALP